MKNTIFKRMILITGGWLEGGLSQLIKMRLKVHSEFCGCVRKWLITGRYNMHLSKSQAIL